MTSSAMDRVVRDRVKVKKLWRFAAVLGEWCIGCTPINLIATFRIRGMALPSIGARKEPNQRLRASKSMNSLGGCIDHGEPEAAAAAVICFEWLQRPENVLAG